MELELFEAMNTVYTYQVVGQDNNVDTSWVFDNGTQNLGMKMAAIKPGALKKYKPSERVAQFFLFRVSETGKTGGAPKTIFKPLQTVSTIAHIIAKQSQEHRLNAFVVRFPKEMNGEGLVGLMQRVANKVSPVKYDQKGFYTFDGMQYGYALFVRQGRGIEAFFGKEWSKYLVHKDVIEYAATFNMTSVAPKQLDKMTAAAELISGITRSLDKQNIRMGIPAKVEIQKIAGGNDVPDDVAEFTASNSSVYQSHREIESYPKFEQPLVTTKTGELESIFQWNVRGLRVQRGDDLEQTPEQAAWQDKFVSQRITAADIASGKSLDFIEQWVTEGFVNGWMEGYRKNERFDVESAVQDACRGYIDAISSAAIESYRTMDINYVNGLENQAAVRGYTGNDYTEMNSALLTGGSNLTDEFVVNKIRKLDKAFETTGVRIQPDAVLYRGMNMTKTLLDTTLKGKAFHFRTFVSTSFRPNVSLYAFNGDLGQVIGDKLKSRDQSLPTQLRPVSYTSPEELSADIELDDSLDNRTYMSMIIRDAFKVPVIIPGDISEFTSECEVILSRGTTMRVNGVNITATKREEQRRVLFGVLDMSILGANEVSINETYDGDHFVETGELKKMGFSSFVEARRVKKPTAGENTTKFFANAFMSLQNKRENTIYTAKEKAAQKRLADKFGGQLLTDGD